ncbi:Rieske 2Fe-2S domain-containing protein [Candidatus Woesearchaeota archaeon]|nr:Rieske 2Fe-2S domain-containing protein [Candidatus Woesearchaeota archaeon]
MKKPNHIILIIVLLVLFILTSELIEFVRNNVFYFLIPLLLSLSLIFWKKKSKLDTLLTTFILIVFLAARLIFSNIDQPTLVLRTSAILSFFLLNLVLLIGPWSRFSDKILRLYYFRRRLGVSAFFLGWLHFTIVISKLFNLNIKNALSFAFTFYGFTAFFIMFWMALTSWDYVQKKFKPSWWNILHTLLLIAYIAFAYLFYTLQKTLNNTLLKYHLYAIAIFVVFWIMVAPYSIVKKIIKTNVFGWKQLHVLVYIAYFSLIVHVVLQGTLKGIFLNAVFYGLIAFVVGSHAVGWLKKINEDNNINKKIKSINKKINEDEKTFIGVAYENEFQESIGKKFYINNKPIAVFKHQGNFIAMSDICAHQKGPLHKGRIVYGYVECPWHKWTYNINDGCSPKPYTDCVPYYKTKVKDSIVYVSTD